MLTLIAFVIVVGVVAAATAWRATEPRRIRRREHRARSRDWKRELRRLDSRAIDAMPRTGGPPDAADRP